MEELLRSLSELLEQNQRFVAYSFPNNNQIHSLIPAKKDEQFTGTRDSGFVFFPFRKDDRSYFYSYKNSEYKKFDFRPEELEPSKIMEQSENEGSEKEQHIQLVNKAKEQIKSTDLQKVIVSRQLSSELNEKKAEQIFQNLLNLYPSAFVYIWHHPDAGIWMGASPECLIKIRQNTFSTVSLAGTKSYIEGEVPLWTQKERSEQQIVTDFISTQMKKFSSSLKIIGPENQRAGNLWHLKTEISGDLSPDITIMEILDQIHPTPAVCGYPRPEALRFITEEENHDREFYTGYLGVIDNKNDRSELYVNLRCMKISETKMHLYVGGGITSDSDAESEWIETVEKSKTILKSVAF